MKLLIIILNREVLLDDILSALVESGIFGATVIESTRITDVLTHDMPIFAGLRSLDRGGRHYNKVIFAAVEEDKLIDEFLEILEEVDINFQEEGVGAILVLPIERVIGNIGNLGL